MEAPVSLSRVLFDFLSLLQACWRIGITGLPIFDDHTDPLPFYTVTCGLGLVLLGPFLGVIAAFLGSLGF